MNFLQTAQQRAYEMDIEELAIARVASGFEVDDAELRLSGMRAKCEELLNSWMARSNQIVNMYCKARNETLEFSGDKTSELYKRLKRHEEKLNNLHWDLAAAIEYLEEYLHPSDEGEISEGEDLPFQSNFGVVAETSDPYKEFDREWAEIMEEWGEDILAKMQDYYCLDTLEELLDLSRKIDGGDLFYFFCDLPDEVLDDRGAFFAKLDQWTAKTGKSGFSEEHEPQFTHIKMLLASEVNERVNNL